MARYKHTILDQNSIWNLLTYLTVICFTTLIAVYFTKSGKSSKSVLFDSFQYLIKYVHITVDTTISVFSRVYTLLSFVLAGYIGICIGRWDHFRANVFGKMWGKLQMHQTSLSEIIRFYVGALENLNWLVARLDFPDSACRKESELSLVRYVEVI